MIARLKAWAQALKRDIMALWLAARDPEVPWPAKAVAGLVAAYALSPIDLIPDFVPVLGYVDDLLIVPAGIWLAVRLIPPGVLQRLRARALQQEWPVSRLGFGLVVLLWLGGAGLVWSAWFAGDMGR